LRNNRLSASRSKRPSISRYTRIEDMGTISFKEPIYFAVKPALDKESQFPLGINRLLCSLSRNKQGNFSVSLLSIESNITLH
jgi:hypothetical protein